MKRSVAIPMVLLGSALVLSGCDDGYDKEQKSTTQQSYNSKADCEADWGTDAQNCKPRANGTGYVGPMYFWNHSAGMPYAVNGDGSTRAISNSAVTSPTFASSRATVSTMGSSSISVARGGFGSSAHAMSAGG